VDERAFERVRVPVDVTVEFRADDDRPGMAGRAVNISAGGLFVETLAPLGRGSDLALAFTLPAGAAGPVSAAGRVAWVNPPSTPRKRDCGPGMGIAFRDLSPDGRTAITRFVRLQRRPCSQGKTLTM
jgi:uncharacterized protein (TIGR02266 family)